MNNLEIYHTKINEIQSRIDKQIDAATIALEKMVTANNELTALNALLSKEIDARNEEQAEASPVSEVEYKVLKKGEFEDGDRVTYLELTGERTEGVIRSEPFKCDPNATMWFFETEEHRRILGTTRPVAGNIWKKPQPSDNSEQLKPLGETLSEKADITINAKVKACTHPHWENVCTGTPLIVTECATCGLQKVG